MQALLAFDLVGPMAHFRRFYTNSSSLSYAFPPRTTLMGILAALRGWERDSYYDALRVERAGIAVALRTPVRRVMQTVNYLQTKSPSGLDGSAGATQIPLELILPPLEGGPLRYRVYFTHEEAAWVDDLFALMNAHAYQFPLYLGITECPARVDHPRRYEPDEWQLVEGSSEHVAIHTVLPVTHLAEAGLKLEPGLRLHRDRVPLDFTPQRRLRRITDVLWEANGAPITAQLQGRLFRTPEGDGTFLE